MATERPLIPPHVRDLSPAEFRYLIDLPYAWNEMLIDASKLTNICLGDLSLRCQPAHAGLTKSALGHLGYLPNETLCSILGNTDPLSVMRLRATSSKLRCIINDWEPFREIFTGAPEVLRALLATRAAVMFTAPQISKVVFTTRCEFCGECGNFLQILKLARCCFRCLANDRRLLSVPMSYAQTTMGLSPAFLPRVPHLATISRASFWGIREERPSCCAVDYNAVLAFARPYPARTVSSELKPYLSELPTIIRRRRRKAQHAYQRRSGVAKRYRQGSAASPLSSYPIATVQPLVTDVNINPPENETFRFLSAVHAPGQLMTTTFDPQTNISVVNKTVLQHGYCKGCRFYWNLSPHLPLEQTIFDSNELPLHIQSCFYARLLWCRLFPRGRINDVLSVMLLKQYPPPFKLRHPASVKGSFEKIPPEAISAYIRSNPTDNGYGDLLLGSQDSISQATWATSSKSAYRALQRSLSLMISRKSAPGTDIGAWKKASQVQLRRPTKIPGPQCVNGLPISSRLDPDHTFFLDHGGERISLWFEEANTRYPVPFFLDTLGQ